MANLVWLDLEMTGLDPYEHKIIEIATAVTNESLELVAEGPNLIIHQPNVELDKMGTWCQEQHGMSGLTTAVRESRESISSAEQKTLSFLASYVEPNQSPMCGNSIGTDRRFLEEYMPMLAAFFHYRNFDVSSFKIAHRLWNPKDKGFKKDDAGSHRALQDVLVSIEEAKFYMKKYWKNHD